MTRLSLRARLTLAFALAMAVVLAGIGLFLYLRLESALDRTIDRNLRARATDVAALVAQADNGLSQAPAGRDGLAQVLYARGGAYDPRSSRPLLDARTLRRVGTAPFYVERTLNGEPRRLLAQRVRAQDLPLVVVVGSSLADRADALATLRRELLIGGPLALLLAALGGYLLASAALRPVERMRRRAAAIGADEPEARLPVPDSPAEISRLGATLNDLLARVQDARESERRFVADASHELRTPLSLLRMEVEVALEEGRPAAELAAALESIGEEVDRLSQLADDLLLIARLDEGELPLRCEPVAVNDLFESVAIRFGPRAERAGRSIEAEPAGDVAVDADRLRVEQALAALVENALRHGGGTVRLRAERHDGTAELHVADGGAGFPPGFLDRAFVRFSRADEARARGGAGLGLAIADEIARAHGGAARAANQPEGGADVAIVLPCARVSVS